MRQFNRRVKTVVVYTLVVLALGACVPTHRITFDENGRINPQTLEINEGEIVYWDRIDESGNAAPLRTTDAIARIGLPGTDETREQICGAVAGGSSEPVTSIPEVNFSGPKRKGISGIHVLAPQGYGNIETSTSDLTATCNDVLDPDDLPNVRYGAVRTVTDTVAGTLHLLCRKEVRVHSDDGGITWEPAADETQGHISQVVPSIWDNPDIDGVVLRVRWKDFQHYDRASASVVTVWDDIDREFREAFKSGKMISINIHAGEDTPDFIFNDYDPDRDPPEDNVEPACLPPNPSRPPESNVEPVCLRDYASESVTPPSCGQDFKLGSPTDPNYVAKIEGLYDALAEHVKADARFFQALGYVKVTGLNLFTGEARLPERCLDPSAGSSRPCLCNTEIWANTVYSYTPAGLYTFYNDIENHIFSAFMGEKSLHYMLIQAGFPRVLDENNYFRDPDHLGDDRTPGTGDEGPVGGGFPGPFQQTENVLEYGRLGRFAQPGDPTNPLYSDDPATGKLFVAQHSGLQIHPMDRDPPDPICPQTEAEIPAGTPVHDVLPDADGKIYYDIYTSPVYPPVVPPLGEQGSGCPNPWAAEQGYLGQLIGFQTMNTVDDPKGVDSSLWNMMSASNAAYYEIYENAAWVIDKEKGHGPDAAVLDDVGYFPRQGTAYQKNLYQWGQQLHERREKLANIYKAYPHMADPYPPAHFHVFSEPLALGEVRDFWYINPGTCMGWDTSQPYGHIRVTGQ